MFGFGAKKVEKERTNGTLSELDKEFIEAYKQTCSRPLGDAEKAWQWAMEQIAYFKGRKLDKKGLHAFEINVVTYLPELYFERFDEFREVVDDATPVVMVCQDMYVAGKAKLAKAFAEPYVRYIESQRNEIIGKKVCCQNSEEGFIMLNDFPELMDKPRTPANYTYLLVMYCTILDAIPYETVEEMDERKVVKNRILSIAKEISPWCSVVYEGLSETVDDEDEYLDYITKALKYTTQGGEPYGLGQVYGNLAMHYVLKNEELAQALCFMSRKHGGQALAASYVLSKVGSGQKEFTNERSAAKVLKEANIQVGFSPLVKKMRRAGIK